MFEILVLMVAVSVVCQSVAFYWRIGRLLFARVEQLQQAVQLQEPNRVR